MDEWPLSDVEFDVLWRELGHGEPPYPIDVPSPGTTHTERARVVADVAAALRGRGVFDADGPDPRLADALSLVATSDLVIDGRIEAERNLRLVAARAGDRAALVVQLGERIGVSAFAGPRLTAVLTDLLPAAPPLPGQPVSVSHSVFTGALRGYGETGSAWDFEHALRQGGVRGGDVRWIAGVVHGTGASAVQLGVTRRERGRTTRRLGHVSWLATAEGGVVLQRQDASEWLTLAPCDAPRLVARLEELAARR